MTWALPSRFWRQTRYLASSKTGGRQEENQSAVRVRVRVRVRVIPLTTLIFVKQQRRSPGSLVLTTSIFVPGTCKGLCTCKSNGGSEVAASLQPCTLRTTYCTPVSRYIV